MVKKKRILAALLSAALAVWGVCAQEGLVVRAGQNTPPRQPYDLKTEMLTYAYGINTRNPAFSWVIDDDDLNEVQTAYRIVVSGTSELKQDILDTGWVVSGENSFVHAEGLEEKLEDNELYYWQVQTKDQDGAESPLSEARPFMTDIGEEWASTDGIWATPYGTSEGDEVLWTDYTVEQTVSVTAGGALGMLLRMGQADQNGYMIQFRTEDNIIKFHKVNGGTVVTDAFAQLNLSDSQVKLPTDGSEFRVKIKAQGSLLHFWIDSNAADGVESYVSAGTVDISSQGNLLSGTIGYRTGRYESGTIDDLKVTSEDGTVLYSSAFSSDEGYFSGCAVSGGKLQVGVSAFSVFGGSLTEAVFGWTDYSVEETICTTDNIYALFRFAGGKESAYMYRVNPKTQEMAFLHRANSSSAPAHIADVSLPGEVELEAGIPFRLRIEANGSQIRAWIDSRADEADTEEDWVLVDSRDVSSLNYGAGYIGFRTDTDAEARISRITVKSLAGDLVYESDFDAEAPENPFSDSSVEEGALVIPGNLRICSIYQEPGAGLCNFSFFRSPHLVIQDPEQVDKAIVSVSSRGTAKDRGVICDVFFNGSCLGAGSARELANVGKNSGKEGYTQVFYNSYDVTHLLAQGDANVISAVGNCRDSERGILVQMTLFYKNGEKQILTNSGTEGSGWKTLDGTKAFGDVGTGISTGYVTLLHENIDASQYPAGWTESGYADTKWASARVTTQVAEQVSGNQGRVLTPFSSENALREETSEPTKTVSQNAQGNMVVDLGKEIIGGLKIRLESDARQKVTVHMGEELNADGTVKYQLSASPEYEDVWTLKSGYNAFETVTMRNFRYVEFIGLTEKTKETLMVQPESVVGWAIRQEFDSSASDFEATDESDAATLLNRLYELSKYTIQATNQDVFVDSQARERAPYEGDLLVNSNTSYAVSGNYSLARHSNEWLMDNPTWPNDYRLFSVEMAYWDYLYTGNTDSLTENYEALKQKLTLEVEYEDAATGLIRANGSQAGNTALIDWPTSERDGYQGSYYDVVFNAEYVGIYQNMAQLCRALGQETDAAYYEGKSEKLKETLLEKAYDEENGCFYDSLAQDCAPTKHSSTHATAYALAYGVFRDQAMADEMCAFVYNQCKEEFKGSVYVTYFILKGLYMGNHGEMAEKLMTNPKVGTNVKTFASLLDNLNCTITPEAWGHQWKSNMTLSHPWGAAPGCSIVQGMFGIVPLEAGFEEFAIKLQPGDVSSARVKAPSVKGAIEVAYENAGPDQIAQNKIRATVKIPANTRAKVSLPVSGRAYDYLMVNGVKTEGENDGRYLTVWLGSGAYELSICQEASEYIPELTVKPSAQKRELEVGEETLITAKVTDQYGSLLQEGLTLSFTSSDEQVLTVTAEGQVKAIGAGEAKVTVAASYQGVSAQAEVSLQVTRALERFELRLSCEDGRLEEGASARADLVAVYHDGYEEIIPPSEVAYDAEGDAVSLETNGTVTALEPGDAVIRAKTAQKLTEISGRIKENQLTEDTVWTFDGLTSPLSGVSVNSGALYAAKSQKVMNTDADKAGSVVSGSFSIEETAASIAFNVKDDDHRYFWQFRQEGYLKKHKGNADVYGELVPIQLKDGYNEFRIATIGGRIYTWLNQELVDVCDTDPAMPASGGFGVRNGMSESFYLKDLSVGSSLLFQAEAALTVIEKQKELPFVISADNPAGIEAAYGTEWKNLPLPQTVTVLLSDGSSANAKVVWSGAYDGTKAGEYLLSGELESQEGFENPNRVAVSLKITVLPKAEEQKPSDQEPPAQKPSAEQPAAESPVVKLSEQSLKLQVKKSTNALKAFGLIAGDQIKSWSSTKKSVATVNAKGKIKAKKAGTTVITVTTQKGASASCRVTVTKKPVKTTKITVANVTGKSLTLKKGKSFRLKVERKPVTASDKVTYRSSKKGVVAVSGKGKLKARKKGNAVITVRAASGKKAIVKVKVK